MAGEGIRPGAVLQETWRIGRRIGEGGMGEVYEATHARLPGRYAVKILHREVASNPEAFARFRREAEITSALRHPNIVHVMDFNQAPDGAPYLVMEFLEGENLGTRIERGPRFSVGETIALVEQIASALAAAHAQGVVHRDLKPQNVFLVPVPGQTRAFPKVVDFGVSKVKSATRNLTRESAVIGTPQYMSPEQALGRGAEVDAPTDQFALGAITYEMLTGEEAFAGENLPAVLYQVVHEDPPPMRGVLLGVEAVVRRALAKRKEARFPGVLDFSRALTEAAGAVTPQPVLMPPAHLSADDAATVVRAASPPVARASGAPGVPTRGYVEKPPTEKPTTFGLTTGQITGFARKHLRPGALAAAVGFGIAGALVVSFVMTRGTPGSARPAAVRSAAGPSTPLTTRPPVAPAAGVVEPLLAPEPPRSPATPLDTARKGSARKVAKPVEPPPPQDASRPTAKAADRKPKAEVVVDPFADPPASETRAATTSSSSPGREPARSKAVPASPAAKADGKNKRGSIVDDF